MKPKDFNINSFIESLVGTCKSISEAYDDYEIQEEDLTGDDLDEIDSEIFCCEGCGWWSEVDEMSESEEQRCKDCASDN